MCVAIGVGVIPGVGGASCASENPESLGHPSLGREAVWYASDANDGGVCQLMEEAEDGTCG